MFRRPADENDRPRVMTFVHKRLAGMRPAFRTDLANHNDVLVTTLYGSHGAQIHFANVYSSPGNSAAIR